MGGIEEGGVWFDSNQSGVWTKNRGKRGGRLKIRREEGISLSWLPHAREKSRKTFLFQGQGNVREFDNFQGN